MSDTTLDTKWGEIHISDDYYSGIEIALGDEARGRLYFPDADVVSDLEQGVQYRDQSSLVPLSYMGDVVKLAQFAQWLMKLYNDAIGDRIEEARAQAEAEREQLEAEQAERALVVEARSDRLMHEFVGDVARIRMSGHKRMRPVKVDVQEMGDGEYRPVLYYLSDRHGYREHAISRVRVFELKIGARYENVWDDGPDDLSSWDRGDAQAASDRVYAG